MKFAFTKKKNPFLLRNGTFSSFVKVDTYIHDSRSCDVLLRGKEFHTSGTPREVASRTQQPGTLILEPDYIQCKYISDMRRNE